MRIHTAIFYKGCNLAYLNQRFDELKELIMATQADLAKELRDLKAQNERDSAEQQAAMKKLQDAIDAAGGTTPEVDQALADLKASMQTRDDLTPTEAPAPAPAPAPEPPTDGSTTDSTDGSANPPSA